MPFDAFEQSALKTTARFGMYQNLKMNFTIPDKAFGTRLTTIFIVIPPYHLNKHKYPSKTSIISSITAKTCIGHSIPIITPTVKVSIDRPMAFAA